MLNAVGAIRTNCFSQRCAGIGWEGRAGDWLTEPSTPPYLPYPPLFAPKVPPILLGIAVGCALYYLGQLVGLGDHLGPVIASGERADGADDLLLWTSSTAKISWR